MCLFVNSHTKCKHLRKEKTKHQQRNEFFDCLPVVLWFVDNSIVGKLRELLSVREKKKWKLDDPFWTDTAFYMASLTVVEGMAASLGSKHRGEIVDAWHSTAGACESRWSGTAGFVGIAFRKLGVGGWSRHTC